MAATSKAIGYRRDVHAHYDDLVGLLIASASLHTALSSYKARELKTFSVVDFPGNLMNYFFPVATLMTEVSIDQDPWPNELVARQVEPEHWEGSGWGTLTLASIKVAVQEELRVSYGRKHSLTNPAFERVVCQMMGSLFLRFFESRLSKLKAHYGETKALWPDIWQFADAVRNAIGHNDCFQITRKGFVSATWREITLTPESHGRQWFGFDPACLAPGDVLLLIDDLHTYSPELMT
ncbi:hypothetical protein [Acidovorax sp.]|uniref:hypothetical protein n=1 Tax=Acidovorax sp. TaxID=1872122 RepID=UPI00391EEBD6